MKSSFRQTDSGMIEEICSMTLRMHFTCKVESLTKYRSVSHRSRSFARTLMALVTHPGVSLGIRSIVRSNFFKSAAVLAASVSAMARFVAVSAGDGLPTGVGGSEVGDSGASCW